MLSIYNYTNTITLPFTTPKLYLNFLFLVLFLPLFYFFIALTIPLNLRGCVTDYWYQSLYYFITYYSVSCHCIPWHDGLRPQFINKSQPIGSSRWPDILALIYIWYWCSQTWRQAVDTIVLRDISLLMTYYLFLLLITNWMALSTAAIIGIAVNLLLRISYIYTSWFL